MANEKMSQQKQILRHLQRYGSITPDEAIRFITPRCFRLAARIEELRKKGYNIITEMTDGYATYRLIEEDTEC